MPPPLPNRQLTLGELLRAARLQRKLTLREAAAGSGISYSTLSRIETGAREMTAPLDALLAVGKKVGLSENDVTRLAAGLTVDGARELVGSHLHRALRGGRLSPEAVTALRRVHVGRLLEPLGAALSRAPVDLPVLGHSLELVMKETVDDPGFDVDGIYLIPAARTTPEKITQRAWQAHGIAHALLARDAHQRPTCRARATALDLESEATYLASLITIPSALLARELRLRPLGPITTADELAAALEEVVSDFEAPVTWAAARLAEERSVAVMPL